MKDLWLKFGCFLTGYNYNIVRMCSEITAKTVKRYTAALLIICILWSFIGYTFTERYLKAGTLGAIAGALVLCVIIIQVERQIILAVHKNRLLYAFRGIIALMMAVIGSIIIDQIIFKEDIEQQKITLLDEKVKKILPAKSEELKRQIASLDTAIMHKEAERSQLTDDISRNPTIKTVTQQTSVVPVAMTFSDSTGSRTNISNQRSNSVTVGSMANPKMALLQPLDDQILRLRAEKGVKDSLLLQLRPTLEKEINSKVGFLDELEVMYSLLIGSNIALVVWLIWVLFLLGLELFILVSKAGEKANDYDETIHHQMALHVRKLKLMAKAGGDGE